MGKSRSRGAKAASARPADKAAAREEARRRRAERLDKPPTWRGAINRAAIAAVIVAVLAVLALGNSPAQAVVLAAVMLVVYIPMGYGFDTLVYRMRQRRKGRSAASAPGADSGRGRDARRG